MKASFTSLKSLLKSAKSPEFFKNKTIVIALAFSLVLVGASFLSTQSSVQKAYGQDKGDEGGVIDDEGGDGDIGFLFGGPGGGAEVCGFAWGATNEIPTPKMGVGWVSFNSKDCDTDGNGTINAADNPPAGCPLGATAPYAVNINSSGYMTGYAWSSNIGWIKFGGLSSFPTTSGNNTEDARIDVNTGTVYGWARACAGTDNGAAPGNCSSMTGRSDGWDGWISLKGSSPSYGLTYALSNGVEKFSGYSWGGPVVGWLKWDQTAGTGVRNCATIPLTASLSANPDHGTQTLNTTLTAVASPAGAGTTYKFKCDDSDLSWQIPDPNTTNTFACSYTALGTSRNWFQPAVEVTRGAETVTAIAEVYVDPQVTGVTIPDGGDNGDLGASCSVSPNPVFINQQASWTATINPEGSAPYTYTFTFSDDVANPIVVNTSSLEAIVPRTYSTLGAKSVDVTVTDQNSLATDSCTANTRVIVRPQIIEI